MMVAGWGLRDFLLAKVPLRAAESDRDGVFVPRDGGMNLLRDCVPPIRFCGGERPAAAGADTGVAGLMKIPVRGVDTTGGSRRRVDADEIVARLYLDGLQTDTSSSKPERFRLLMESKMVGSTFSESESSGEGARRLREGAELGVIAALY
jgi:hypothetical protein